MKIIFSSIAIRKLNDRGFSEETIIEIVSSPDLKYYDSKNKSTNFIKKISHNGKTRPVLVAADILDNKNVRIRTAHPEKNKTIKNRLKSKRYKNI